MSDVRYDYGKKPEVAAQYIDVIQYYINYGYGNLTLNELRAALTKGHPCPKCHRSGMTERIRTTTGTWGYTADVVHVYYDICDLCHGRGYTEDKYEPNYKKTLDGFRKVDQ